MTAKIIPAYQSGASLIEVLVSIVILAFGLLSLGSMIGYSIQAPKLAVNRAIAANIASNYIDRIRANASTLDTYAKAATSYTGNTNVITLNDCTFPDCTPSTLAAMDIAAVQRMARHDLPAGGVWVSCDGNCDTVDIYKNKMNLWVIWQEPESLAALDAVKSDNCPGNLPTIQTGKMAPRCLYVRFKPA